MMKVLSNVFNNIKSFKIRGFKFKKKNELYYIYTN